MLNENIKKLRKAKGLSQEELAVKLNVVRQTVSKWENGLSVPDSSMLIELADELDSSVSKLLGDDVETIEPDDLKAISEKLEVINLQLANRERNKTKALRWTLAVVSAVIILTFIVIAATDNFYLDWNLNDPETAVAATFIHGFVFVFVRVAPIILLGCIGGLIMTWRKR